MNRIYFLISNFLFAFLFFTNFAYAHNILQTLSKEQLIQVQQNLVAKGYLKMPPGAKYGVYGPLTDEAFDKFQADRDARIYKEETLATPTEIKEDSNFLASLWQGILNFIKVFF